MKEEFVKLIVERLESESDVLKHEFQKSREEVGVRYCQVKNLLPESMALKIYESFPEPFEMRLMKSFRERKFTSKNFDDFNKILADITFAMQDVRVVEVVEYITGILGQVPDKTLYAGGLSAMNKGHFLNPHIDNSHELNRKLYRTLNLLYYTTPNWSLKDGGNLELWDRKVKNKTTIVSEFNSLALMETTPYSWHSVSKVKRDKTRCCVSNYYFSERSPTGSEYFNVTSFSARPEQKVRRVIAYLDNKVREGIRYLRPSGLGKKDIYK
ncbi:2OG-Fe(II) oxygenase [Aliikangiella sp. IMCC44632]